MGPSPSTSPRAHYRPTRLYVNVSRWELGSRSASWSGMSSGALGKLTGRNASMCCSSSAVLNWSRARETGTRRLGMRTGRASTRLHRRSVQLSTTSMLAGLHSARSLVNAGWHRHCRPAPPTRGRAARLPSRQLADACDGHRSPFVGRTRPDHRATISSRSRARCPTSARLA